MGYFKITKKTLFFILTSLTISSQAQLKCGQENLVKKYFNKIDSSEVYKKYQKTNQNTIKIPIAIHFPEGLESDRSCLVNIAQKQIAVLNEDFNANNSQISNWDNDSVYYPYTSIGNLNVIFCLATLNHPAGTDTNLIHGEPAVTVGYDFGNGTLEDSNWAGYVNIVVKGSNNSGYSPLGGIVSLGQAFEVGRLGFGKEFRCEDSDVGNLGSLGRLSVHEMGHFFNLPHTFSIDCFTDDGIIDTPNQSAASSGCPVLGSVPACMPTEQVLYQNFMDYTSEYCKYMFTQGQVDVMRAYLISIQNDFKANVLACSVRYSVENNPQTICNSINNSVQFNINYESQPEDIFPTVFTLNNLPNNVTYSFNPPSLSENGSTTLTINNLNYLTSGYYTSVLSSNNSSGLDELPLLFIIDDNIPTAPNIMGPNDGSYVNPTNTNLEWEELGNDISYQIDIAMNSDFSNIYDNIQTEETEVTLDNLIENTTYFWRIKAINSCGESTYSNIRNFTTSNITCLPINSTQNNIQISDGGEPIVLNSSIYVDTDITLTDVNITVNIDHTSVQDLMLSITNPQGVEVVLSSNNGDDGNHYTNTTFDQQGINEITEGQAPFTGIFIPEENLDILNGQSSLGNWTLSIVDITGQNGGVFENFSLELCGISTLNTVDYNYSNNVLIWPNPAKDAINLSFNKLPSTKTTIKIFDLGGRLINIYYLNKNLSNNNTQIDLNNFKKSIYFLQISNEEYTINKRLVVE